MSPGCRQKVQAMEMGNLNADFRSTAATGCRSYKIAGDPNRKWRVPTQRELQLRWLFREPVGVIYPAAQMENVSSKIYWGCHRGRCC